MYNRLWWTKYIFYILKYSFCRYLYVFCEVTTSKAMR